jgi:hypothetical protein
MAPGSHKIPHATSFSARTSYAGLFVPFPPRITPREISFEVGQVHLIAIGQLIG